MSHFALGNYGGAATADASSIFGTDLVGWHKADTGVTKDSSNLVSSWADNSSSAATVMQVTGTAQPTYNATGLNGKPTLQFDPSGGATGSGLFSSSAALPMTATNHHSLFAVINLRSLGHPSDAWLFAYLRSTGGGFPWDNTQSCVWGNLDRTDNKLQATSNSSNFAKATVATGTLYRYSIVADGTNWTTYLNNVQQGQTAYNQTLAAAGQLQIGGEFGFVDTTRGIFDLSELIIVKRNASSADRTATDNYLKTKWGL